MTTPERIGQYEIVRRLGSGGMAEVFLARRWGAESTFKMLVVKRVLPQHGASRRFRAMFIAEAQLATRLNHPNIVQVYDFQDIGEEGQLLTMEYVEGTDLGRVMSSARQKGTRVPPWVAAYIIGEAAKGLHYAHERKDEEGRPLAIVHRDVSPQNILLSFDGAVKIADFGIASANLFREEQGVLKGKFGFMSPEQARGEAVDRRSDIYALGVCLHELLTGRYLHGALAGDDLLDVVRRGDVEPPSTYVRDVPEELEAIVMRALAKSAEDRFQTARDFAGATARATLATGELIDAAAVEGMLANLVGREHTSPGVAAAPEADASVIPESVRVPMTVRGDSERPPEPEKERKDVSRDQTNAEGPRPGKARGGREVRHVAVVTLRLFGLDELRQRMGEQRAAYASARIRMTLSEIAYKRSTEWTWKNDEARAIVGLLANPSRAAQDAAWLAVDAQEALAGASGDLDEPVLGSIAIVRGIASGERDPEGRLIKPELEEPAEHLAKLLQDRAPKGGIWVAGGLYRLVRRDFRWGDAPSVDVPPIAGSTLPRAMRVYALERPLSREEKVAELALLPSDLVGREAEKADLLAAYHAALTPKTPDGRGVVTARGVVGEMGIGKTALVASVLGELPPDARVIRVEASASRIDVPFGAVGELVRDALQLEPDATAEVTASIARDILGPLADGEAGEVAVAKVTELASGAILRASDDEDVAFRKKVVGSALRRLLAALAMRSPLVIVVDGMHWVDKPSLELMHELTRRGDPLPILALLVTRPEDRALVHLEGMVRIDLGGLSHEEQVRLVEQRLGVEKGVAAVCADIVPRVAGNPFFLLEMIDALLERGTLELATDESGEQMLRRAGGEEQAGERLALPSTLEQILGDRIRELPRGERDVVEWLAVAGGAVTLTDLTALAGPEAEEHVTRLCARGICDQRGDSVDVRHAITRDVAYAATEGRRRRKMHKDLGELLGKTPLAKGLTAAIVARHLARGEARKEAGLLYLEAGEAARAGYQTQLAIRYFHRALLLLPENDAQRLLAHEALEAMYRILGRRKDRRAQLGQLRRMARDLGHARWVTVALTRSARLDLDEGHAAHGLPLALKAAALAREQKSPTLEVEAESVASELLRDLGDTSGALSACDRALGVATTHPEVPARVRADVLRARGVLLRRLGRVQEAVEAYAEAIAIFKRTGARRQEARVKNALAMAMLVSERWEDAIALALSSINIDLAIGGRFQIAKTLTNVGQSYARLGDLPRAVAYLRRAREAHQRYGDQDAHADTLLVSAEVMIQIGDLAAAHTFVGDAAALNAVMSSAYDTIHERLVRALLARAEGDDVTAGKLAGEARRQAEDKALAAFHLYAMAVEAVSRVSGGDYPVGVMLATTALHATAHTPTEYTLEVQDLATEALVRADAASAEDACLRAGAHVRKVEATIRDPRFRESFLSRAVVRAILERAEAGRIR